MNNQGELLELGEIMLRFDPIWVSNRFRYRKTLKGTRLTKDPTTGFLEPVGRKGFTAEMRKTFIDRFKICNNMSQICKSLDITIASIYDAVAVDERFREEMNKCVLIKGRSKKLSTELEKLAGREKNQVITDLAVKAIKYE